ncbi:hypothetical protein BDZ94DRAFT_1289354 [Collybia nuda]|uniref:Uncharacterized protein n=1 Tax=Collybia nuda TaxID=64659 RepID=A0A9P5Y8X7_9AGAR|nr:hypothetical protein BDZ94DRAFT_1289354 [Collybia nuda]
MSDFVLQHVLSDLRPHILPKLKVEADLQLGTGHVASKKTTVDTHRGETYQFCYFIRKTEPHSVVIKTRNFVAVPPQKSTMPPPPTPRETKHRKGKRKGEIAKNLPDVSRKKRKTKGKARQTEDKSGTSGGDDSDYSPPAAPSMTGVDILQARETIEFPPAEVDLQPDDEEEKPKPTLQLKYQGFSIYGHCLCVVVEPWPPIRSITRAPSVTSFHKTTYLNPSDIVPSERPDFREETPLFLPDYELDRERSETPAPLQGWGTPSPRGPNLSTSFFEDSDSSDDGCGMMELSQVLSATGDFRAGAVDDDEDVDTSIFFGDADEAREL